MAGETAENKAQAKADEKERLRAERMAPRDCRLCKTSFVPKRVQDWRSEFCCREHQQKFWLEANRAGAAVVAGKAFVAPAAPVPSELQPGVSHKLQVLAVLKRHAPNWVENPRQILPGVIWNSRISDLRQQGYQIESRVVGKRPFVIENGYRRFLPGGNVQYQYRLVTAPESEEK
jgi:hypothetical protein